MSAIPEDEAKKYPDLYKFETNCIDFLLALKRRRQGNFNWTSEDVIRPAKEMQAFITQVLEQEEQAE